MTAADERIVLVVTDDGRGFDSATLLAREAEGHVGLKALRGLVADAGGTVQPRRDARGRGTTVAVEVPER